MINIENNQIMGVQLLKKQVRRLTLAETEHLSYRKNIRHNSIHSPELSHPHCTEVTFSHTEMVQALKTSSLMSKQPATGKTSRFLSPQLCPDCRGDCQIDGPLLTENHSNLILKFSSSPSCYSNLMIKLQRAAIDPVCQ